MYKQITRCLYTFTLTYFDYSICVMKALRSFEVFGITWYLWIFMAFSMQRTALIPRLLSIQIECFSRDCFYGCSWSIAGFYSLPPSDSEAARHASHKMASFTNTKNMRSMKDGSRVHRISYACWCRTGYLMRLVCPWVFLGPVYLGLDSLARKYQTNSTNIRIVCFYPG